MSAIHMYKRTWRLNILWMGAFYGLILQDVSDVPNSIQDVRRGGLPIVSFTIWIALQRDALARRDKTESVLTNWKKKMLGRLKELPQGLEKRESFYALYVALEVLIFLELAAFLAAGLWPWISGQAPGGGVFRLGGSLIAFSATLLSWKYVKDSNRAAARALQEEIDEP